MQEETSYVLMWWYALSAVAVVNLGLWALSYGAFVRGKAGADPQLARRWPHLLLSAGYVLGCAFRSLLPRADVQRICLYDSWLSSVFVGRSVATIAELCFAAQWALILRELSRDHEHSMGQTLSRLVFPFIFVAELFSWYAVLSTSYLGNTLEQSIWTLTVCLIAISLVPLFRRTQGALRRFVGLSIAGSIAFVIFMCSVDVPMYLTRYLADQASQRPYLTLAQGFHDVTTRWVVTHEFADWRQEMAWMALYFSLAVWFSIGLTHAPRATPRNTSSARARARPHVSSAAAPAE